MAASTSAALARVKSGLKLPNGPADQFMYEIAEGNRMELKWLLLQANWMPTEGVAPDKPEWIAQQALECCRRLGASKRSDHGRMIGRDQAIMSRSVFSWCQLRQQSLRLLDARQLTRVARSRQEAIRFAEGMFGNAVALPNDFVLWPERTRR